MPNSRGGIGGNSLLLVFAALSAGLALSIISPSFRATLVGLASTSSNVGSDAGAYQAILTSGCEALVGAILGVALALTLFALEWIRPQVGLVLGLFDFLQVMPPLMFVPLAVVVVGVEKGSLLAPGIFVLVSSFGALRRAAMDIPKDHLDLAAALRLPRWKTFAKIALPWAIRIGRGAILAAVGAMVGVLILVEYLARPQGVGALLKEAVNNQRWSDMGVSTYLALLAACIVVLVIDMALQLCIRTR